jgi:hypothetical protein
MISGDQKQITNVCMGRRKGIIGWTLISLILPARTESGRLLRLGGSSDKRLGVVILRVWLLRPSCVPEKSAARNSSCIRT